MKRTTVLADEALLLDAKYLAKQLGKSFTDVVREALAEYVVSHRPGRKRVLSVEGIGHGPGAEPGDERDLAERLDDMLRTEIEPDGEWSPRRSPEARVPDAGPRD